MNLTLIHNRQPITCPLAWCVYCSSIVIISKRNDHVIKGQQRNNNNASISGIPQGNSAAIEAEIACGYKPESTHDLPGTLEGSGRLRLPCQLRAECRVFPAPQQAEHGTIYIKGWEWRTIKIGEWKTIDGLLGKLCMKITEKLTLTKLFAMWSKWWYGCS